MFNISNQLCNKLKILRCTNLNSRQQYSKCKKIGFGLITNINQTAMDFYIWKLSMLWSRDMLRAEGNLLRQNLVAK
jgi:hypothetical protein